MTIRVAIVEDHDATRELWTTLIGKAEGFEFTRAFADAETAIANLPSIAPDVVLVDINLPGASGMECVRRLKPQMPGTQFMMITVYEDVDHVFEALASGATGYLLKSTSSSEMLDAIREVQAGGSPMAGNIARKVVQSFHSKDAPPSDEATLTAREREVLELLARGDLYKEIADTLGISVPTVSTHIRKIYEKLHVRSRAQAVARFIRLPR
jgi:DNA-binding NarL/FixJ family response regulator